MSDLSEVLAEYVGKNAAGDPISSLSGISSRLAAAEAQAKRQVASATAAAVAALDAYKDELRAFERTLDPLEDLIVLGRQLREQGCAELPAETVDDMLCLVALDRSLANAAAMIDTIESFPSQVAELTTLASEDVLGNGIEIWERMQDLYKVVPRLQAEPAARQAVALQEAMGVLDEVNDELWAHVYGAVDEAFTLADHQANGVLVRAAQIMTLEQEERTASGTDDARAMPREELHQRICLLAHQQFDGDDRLATFEGDVRRGLAAASGLLDSLTTFHDEIAPCFPPEWDVFSWYVQQVHMRFAGLAVRFASVTESRADAGELFDTRGFLQFVGWSWSVYVFSLERLGVSATNLEPSLSSCLSGCIPHYAEELAGKLSQWSRRTLVDEFCLDSDSLTLIDSQLVSVGPTQVFDTLLQQIDILKKAQSLEIGLASARVMKEAGLGTYIAEWQRILDTQLLPPRPDPLLVDTPKGMQSMSLELLVAHVNNAFRCRDFCMDVAETLTRTLTRLRNDVAGETLDRIIREHNIEEDWSDLESLASSDDDEDDETSDEDDDDEDDDDDKEEDGANVGSGGRGGSRRDAAARAAVSRRMVKRALRAVASCDREASQFKAISFQVLEMIVALIQRDLAAAVAKLWGPDHVAGDVSPVSDICATIEAYIVDDLDTILHPIAFGHLVTKLCSWCVLLYLERFLTVPGHASLPQSAVEEMVDEAAMFNECFVSVAPIKRIRTSCTQTVSALSDFASVVGGDVDMAYAQYARLLQAHGDVPVALLERGFELRSDVPEGALAASLEECRSYRERVLSDEAQGIRRDSTFASISLESRNVARTVTRTTDAVTAALRRFRRRSGVPEDSLSPRSPRSPRGDGDSTRSNAASPQRGKPRSTYAPADEEDEEVEEDSDGDDGDDDDSSLSSSDSACSSES